MRAPVYGRHDPHALFTAQETRLARENLALAAAQSCPVAPGRRQRLPVDPLCETKTVRGDPVSAMSRDSASHEPCGGAKSARVDPERLRRGRAKSFASAGNRVTGNHALGVTIVTLGSPLPKLLLQAAFCAEPQSRSVLVRIES